MECARCRKEISENDCYWQEDGQICAPCMALQERKDHFLKIYGGLASASLGGGGACFFFDPFFVISIGAAISGFGALKHYFFPFDEEDRGFSRKNMKFFWMALSGICLAMIKIAVSVFRLHGIFTS